VSLLPSRTWLPFLTYIRMQNADMDGTPTQNLEPAEIIFPTFQEQGNRWRNQQSGLVSKDAGPPPLPSLQAKR
jgi:hypothetical protein